MARVLQGNFAGEGKKIAIVASRFNEFITTSCSAAPWTPCSGTA